MYYIEDGYLYFYKRENKKAYAAEVSEGSVTVDFSTPIPASKKINCLYSLDEVVRLFENNKSKKHFTAKKEEKKKSSN